jgi:hypothetical protein
LANSTGNLASGQNVDPKKSAIKVATPDLIVFDSSSLSVDSMADLIFEDIGGQELLEISRSDLINSSNVVAPKIKTNIKTNSQTNIDAIAGGQYLTPSQSIDLFVHVPEFVQPVILNEGSGQLEINLINILPEYQVEVQIVSKASRFDDTIYSS